MRKEVLNIPTLIPFFILPSNEIADFTRYIIVLALIFNYFIDFIEEFLISKPFVFTILIFGIVLGMGSVGLVRFEDMKLADVLWLSFISATTVGYGDISAVTSYGKLVTVFVTIGGAILFGALLVTIVINKIADYTKSKYHQMQKDDTNVENVDNVHTLFEAFKMGEINVIELEEEVVQEINKRDK